MSGSNKLSEEERREMVRAKRITSNFKLLSQ